MTVATTRVLWMLWGMSLELIYKAIIVARRLEPSPIHDLEKLAATAGVQISTKQRGLLAILSHAVVWYGRYPVPKPKAKAHVEELGALADEHLWEAQEGSPFKRANRALAWQSFDDLWQAAHERLSEIRAETEP